MYILNNNIKSLADDFFDLLESKFLNIFEQESNTGDEQSISNFFLYGYYAVTLKDNEYQYYMENQIDDDLLSKKDKEKFLAFNSILKTERLDFLDDNELYCELIKGQICIPPKDDKEKKDAVRQIQNILVPKYISMIKKLDIGLKYLKHHKIEKSINAVTQYIGPS